jgi:hypothetical protein
MLTRGWKYRGLLQAEIPAPGNFTLKIPARNSGPLLKVAPQLEKKDLAKICRIGNYRIFGPQKFSSYQNFRPLYCELHHSSL